MCPKDPLADPSDDDVDDYLDDELDEYSDEVRAEVELPQTKPLPWSRFWARQVDMGLCGLLVGFVLGIIASFDGLLPFALSVDKIPRGLVAVGPLGILVVIEATLLATIGTTPGKWLLRVKVRDRRGRFPSFASALHRSFLVWVMGLGFGLPCISLITVSTGWQTLVNNGVTTWDKKTGCVVTHPHLGWVRCTMAVLVIVTIFALIVTPKIMSMQWQR